MLNLLFIKASLDLTFWNNKNRDVEYKHEAF